MLFNRKTLTIISFFIFSMFLNVFPVSVRAESIELTETSSNSYTFFSQSISPIETNVTLRFSISQMRNSTHSQTINDVASISINIKRLSSNSLGTIYVKLRQFTDLDYLVSYPLDLEGVPSEADFDVNSVYFPYIMNPLSDYYNELIFEVSKSNTLFQYAMITIVVIYNVEVTNEGLNYDSWNLFYVLLLQSLNLYWVGLIASLFTKKYSFYVANLYILLLFIINFDFTILILFGFQFLVIASERKKEVEEN